MFTNEGGSNDGGANNGGAPAAPPPAPTASDWMGKFTPEQKGWYENKGFKDPSDMVNSYQNFEKLMGGPREKLVKLPDSPDAPEWGEVFDKLGRPKTPADYGIKSGENDDPAFADWASKNFHELGLTKAQGEKLVGKWGEFYEAQEKNFQKAITDKALVEEQALKQKWGNGFDQEMNVAKQAAKAFGMPMEVVDKLEQTIGFGKTMEFLNNVGKKMGEGTFIDGGSGSGQNFSMSPSAAQQKLDALKSDPVWTKAYLGGEAAQRSEMERLLKIISG